MQRLLTITFLLIIVMQKIFAEDIRILNKKEIQEYITAADLKLDDSKIVKDKNERDKIMQYYFGDFNGYGEILTKNLRLFDEYQCQELALKKEYFNDKEFLVTLYLKCNEIKNPLNEKIVEIELSAHEVNRTHDGDYNYFTANEDGKSIIGMTMREYYNPNCKDEKICGSSDELFIKTPIQKSVYYYDGTKEKPPFKTSFDCSANNLNKTEKIICNNLPLANLDLRLSWLYKYKLDNNKNDQEKLEKIKKQQRQWNREKNKIHDVKTLIKFYEDRLSNL